jgi:hypothetical protein
MRVELENLVGALAHLTLGVEHKAASEDVHLVAKAARRVTLPALDHLLRRVGSSLPLNEVLRDGALYDFLNCVRAHTANHIHRVVVRSQGCTLARLGSPPLTLLLGTNLDAESLTLLHTLDVGLDTAR